jgi:hypothetical protein
VIPFAPIAKPLPKQVRSLLTVVLTVIVWPQVTVAARALGAVGVACAGAKRGQRGRGRLAGHVSPPSEAGAVCHETYARRWPRSTSAVP